MFGLSNKVSEFLNDMDIINNRWYLHASTTLTLVANKPPLESHVDSTKCC